MAALMLYNLVMLYIRPTFAHKPSGLDEGKFQAMIKSSQGHVTLP